MMMGGIDVESYHFGFYVKLIKLFQILCGCDFEQFQGVTSNSKRKSGLGNGVR